MNGHPLRRLGQDVDIHTMYHMRDQGMSNKEIAQALGVSYATVYKYIGKQERRGGTAVSPSVAPKKTREEIFTKTKRLTLLEGRAHSFVVDLEGQRVRIDPRTNMLDVSGLDALLDELQYIRDLMT